VAIAPVVVVVVVVVVQVFGFVVLVVVVVSKGQTPVVLHVESEVFAELFHR
jgi:hypothetical protein